MSHDDIRKALTPVTPPEPEIEEPYYGPVCADGTKPDLKRALKDYRYYASNREAIHMLRKAEEVAAQEAAETERLAKRKQQVLDSRARAEAVREVEAEERKRAEAERQAKVEERVRARREATS